jgi:radial spoke head protein 4A
MAAGIATEMNVLAPGIDILIALEEATQRRLLFAIVINEQNEVHRSITVNILHGLPQEHRNMPVDDAITLITRSFDKYVIDRRDRADSFGPPPPPLPGPPGPVGPELSFLPAGPRVQYLLNLLADQRFLTIAELTVVIDYLVERRRMMEPPPREREPSINRERFDDRDVGYPPEARRVDATEMRKSLDVDERERQSYLPPQRSLDISESRRISESVAPVPTPVPAASATTTPSNASLAQMINTSINFDNPTVRQALDNLIQSGPNLFRSLTDNAR